MEKYERKNPVKGMKDEDVNVSTFSQLNDSGCDDGGKCQ